MEKISVAQARKARRSASRCALQGWVRTRRDSKGGFSFLELNDGSCLGNVQVIAETALPNYESEVLHLSAGCSVTVDGRGPGVAGQGPGRPRCRRQASSSTAGPTRRPTRCRRRAIRWSSCASRPTCGRAPTPSAPSPASAIRSAGRSTISSRSRASSTSTRRSSPPATARAPARCSGSPRSTSASCRATTRARSTTPRTSSAGRPI